MKDQPKISKQITHKNIKRDCDSNNVKCKCQNWKHGIAKKALTGDLSIKLCPFSIKMPRKKKPKFFKIDTPR